MRSWGVKILSPTKQYHKLASTRPKCHKALTAKTEFLVNLWFDQPRLRTCWFPKYHFFPHQLKHLSVAQAGRGRSQENPWDKRILGSCWDFPAVTPWDLPTASSHGSEPVVPGLPPCSLPKKWGSRLTGSKTSLAAVPRFYYQIPLVNKKIRFIQNAGFPGR